MNEFLRHGLTLEDNKKPDITTDVQTKDRGPKLNTHVISAIFRDEGVSYARTSKGIALVGIYNKYSLYIMN